MDRAHDQQLAYTAERDRLKVKHKEQLKLLRLQHSDAIAAREKKFAEIEAEQLGYIELYNGVLAEYDNLIKQDKRGKDKIGKLTNSYKKRLNSLREFKDNQRKAAADLSEEQLDMM